MIRIGLLAIALSLALSSCNGQAKSENPDQKLISKPQSDISVNKEYDKDGNLIRYDSSYTYYYSNIRDNEGLQDSILNNFKSHFNNRYSFSKDPFFNGLFFEDSLLQYDFYKKDFFLNRFKDNMRKMDSLFWQMDSVKNNFFNRQFSIPGPVLKAPQK